MKQKKTSIGLLATFAAILAIGVFIATPNAAAACLGASAARNLVNTGNVLSLGSIASRLNMQIYSAQLCSRGGNYVYELMVRGNGGNIRKVIINARTGRQIS